MGSDLLIFIAGAIVVFWIFYKAGNYIQKVLSERKKLQERITSLSEQHINTVEDINIFSDKPDVGVIEKRIHVLLTPVNQSKRFKLWFRQSGIEMPIVNIIINTFSVSIIAIALLVLLTSWPMYKIILSVFAISIGGVLLTIRLIRKNRLDKITAAMPDALIMIAQFLKAGFNLDGALEVCSKETPGILGEEIRKILLQTNSGVAYEDALKESSERVGLNAFSIFIGALIIQNRIGASAALVIENIINILQKRVELEAKIQSMSAEATATYAILLLTQVFLALALWYNSPKQMMYFINNPTGQNIGLVILFMLVTQFFSFKMLTKVRME